MGEENEQMMRNKDTRMSVALALTQVHQDTGDPVTNSPTFCLIPTAVLLIYYKVHRVIQIIVIYLYQFDSENISMDFKILRFDV